VTSQPTSVRTFSRPKRGPRNSIQSSAAAFSASQP
jgi:hypothetical protein